ncbi:MAG: hypothetical protein WBL74_09440 [Novosphingobium sp.]|uniref:hypothetical protein n=1 Tax=Novosphingobium sp. TaxID=1874826 RepID=UPI003C7E4060
MMRKAALALAVYAAACSPDPAQQAREDTAAVAAVNAAQNRIPPLKALGLEQLSPEDFSRMDDTGASCAFYLGTVPQAHALMVARPSYGWIKIDSELIRLTSDSGSNASPLGTRSHYTGKDLTVRIEPRSADSAASHEPRQIVPAQLIVRDRWDRVVFAAAGEQRCAAQ